MEKSLFILVSALFVLVVFHLSGLNGPHTVIIHHRVCFPISKRMWMFWLCLFDRERHKGSEIKHTHRLLVRAGSRSEIMPCFSALQSAWGPAHEHTDGQGSGSRSESPWSALNPVRWNTSSAKLTARAGCGIFTHNKT